MSDTVVVQKYGGSSVADLERLEAVAQRVATTHRAGHGERHGHCGHRAAVTKSGFQSRHQDRIGC